MARRRNSRNRPAGRAAPRRRWPWGAAAVLGLCAAAVGAAPAIVAGTSLREQIVRWALPQFQGRAAIGSASFGWFSPAVVHDVQVFDADGQPLLELASLRTEKTLWQLVQNPANLGQIWLQGLTVHARLSDDGSNLEDALAGLSDSDSPAATPPAFRITLAEGAVHIDDRASGRRWSITELQAEALHAPLAAAPFVLTLTGNVRDPSQQGAFYVNLAGHASGGELHLVSENLPLDPLAGAARRWAGNCAAAGQLTSDLKVRFSDQPGSPLEIDGRVQAAALELHAPDWLGSDPQYVLKCEWLDYGGRLLLGPGHVAAENVRIAADIGNLELDGAAPLELPADQPLAQWLAALGHNNLRARGSIDVAKLATAAPGLLRIRETAEINRGAVQFAVESRPHEGRRAWFAELASTDITGTSAGRPFEWKQPVVVKLAARDTPHGLYVDELLCRGDFFQASGKGHWHEASFTAQADLGQLAARLGEIVELDEVKLSGSVHAALRARRGEDRRVSIDGKADIEHLLLEAPGLSPWHEKKLTLTLQAVADAPDDAAGGVLQTAALTLASGDDTLAATLTQPVPLAGAPRWPIAVEAQGGLASWAPRLQTVLPLEGWKVSGDVHLTAKANLSPASIELVESQCDLAKLVAQGHGHYYREQMVRIAAAGDWDVAGGRGAAKALTLATTTCSLRGDDVAFALREYGGHEMHGQFAFRSDIRRTLEALRPPGPTPEFRVRGQAEGTLQLAVARGTSNATASVLVDNFVVETVARPAAGSVGLARPVAAAPSVSPLWMERQLKLDGQVAYAAGQDLLELREVKVEGSGAALACRGKISSLTTSPAASVSGEATYNLALLVERLRPLVGDQLQLAGKETAAFSLDGPLFPPAPARSASASEPSPPPLLVSPELVAAVKLPWESVQIYGLPIGKGTLQGELRRGIVNVQPMTLDVSEGRLHLAPRFYLNEAPPLAMLDRGPVLERVQLTPQLCREWLKFVAPLLADATQCKGSLSAEVERIALPLSALHSGSLSGVLAIHGADVRPGPLANQYIDAVGRIEAALKGEPREAARRGGVRLVHLDEQTLQVHMADGRVHHRGLTMKIGDVPVVTSGSVGVEDQTLDLLVEIAVQDEWIDGRQFLSGLHGQSIRVPVRGTVGRPQVDLSVIEQLGRQLIGGTAQRLFSKEVNNLLNQLVKPPAAERPAEGEPKPSEPAGGGPPAANQAPGAGFGSPGSRFRPQGFPIGNPQPPAPQPFPQAQPAPP